MGGCKNNTFHMHFKSHVGAGIEWAGGSKVRTEKISFKISLTDD